MAEDQKNLAPVTSEMALATEDASPKQRVDFALTDPLTHEKAKALAKTFALSGLYGDTSLASLPTNHPKVITAIAQCASKILYGHDIGMPPAVAVKELYVVNGRVGMYAAGMAALLKQSKRYRYRLIECTEIKAVIEFLELVGTAWEVVGKSQFTKQEAEKAKLVARGGAWETWTEDMLFARAMSRGCRRFAPDVFLGGIYTVEELADMPPMQIESTDVTNAAPAALPEGASAETPAPEPAKKPDSGRVNSADLFDGGK